MNIVTINNKHYNLSAIVKIHDRQVYFNDGKSETFTEPELQELFSWLFTENNILKAVEETKKDLETYTIVAEPLVIKKKVVKKK
jgi:hypothetical protein